MSVQRTDPLAYLPVLLGLLTAFCWGTADYLSRRQSRLVGYFRTVAYSHLTTLVFLLAILAVVNPPVSFPPVPTEVLILIGAVNFVAFVFLYRAFHRGTVSVVAPVAYTYPVVTTFFSVVLLGTSLSLAAGLGISGVIVGVILLSTRFSELRVGLQGPSAVRLTAGLGSAISASFFFGMVYVGVGYATPYVGYAVPPVLLRGVAIVVAVFLAPLLRENIRPSHAALSNTVIVMGALESVGFLSFNYGISVAADSLPAVAALSGMGGAVAASYALVFLKERLELNQILGMTLSMVGVFTLLYIGG